MKDTTKKFYVYVHKYASGPKKGMVFYVGKGCGRRAWSKYKRGDIWDRIVSKYGYEVKIVIRLSAEVCAYGIEASLISLYGIENLANITHGGVGPTWRRRTEYEGEGNPRFDAEKYMFKHDEKGYFYGTKSGLSKAHGVNIFGIYSAVSGRRTHVAGWHMDGVRPNLQKGCDHPMYDATLYSFMHPDHGVVSDTKYGLCMKYGLSRSNLNEMIKGKYKTTKGWALHEV